MSTHFKLHFGLAHLRDSIYSKCLKSDQCTLKDNPFVTLRKEQIKSQAHLLLFLKSQYDRN